MNILIVSYEFPPLNTIGSQRPYSWAKYWSRLGHRVCVLTAKKKTFDGPIDSNFDDFEISSVRVEEVDYWLESSKEPSHKINSGIGRSHQWLNRAKSIAKKIRLRLGMGALLSVKNLWIRSAVAKGVSLHQEQPFDFIISTYGPPASHLVGSRLQKKLQIYWVADYRDLWSGTHFQEASGGFFYLQRALENYAVAKADLFTTVSVSLCDTLASRFERPVLTIENGFDTEEVPTNTQTTVLVASEPKLKLVYTGTVRTNQQCVRPLFKALAQVKHKLPHLGNKLEVLLYGGQFGEIPLLIDEYCLEDIVSFPGFLDRQDVLTVQREADALLFFDWKESIDGILTGKIFEYLYAATPILGIGSDETRAAGRLIRDSGTGLCLGDSSKDIADILYQLLRGDPLQYAPKVDVLAQYTREGLAYKLLDAITEKTSGSKLLS